MTLPLASKCKFYTSGYMQTMKEKYWKYSLIALILGLGAVIVGELWAFVNGLLGAFTIFVLVRGQMIRLTERWHWPRVLATVVVLMEVAVVILGPLTLIGWVTVERVQHINMDISGLQQMLNDIDRELRRRFGYHFSFDNLTIDNLTMATGYLSRGVQYVIGQVSSMAVTIIVLVFFLYFILVDFRRIERYVYDLLPFKEAHRRRIVNEIYRMVRSNAVGIPLIAIVQGAIAYAAYLFFDIPSALLFAFLTCFSTIIPIIGTGIVWVPLVIYLLIVGRWVDAAGLAAYCSIILINIDNVVRFILQKRLADTHPLITVFGVILGLSIFGFWGIIFGPLLISMFFLLVNIFKEEYLDGEKEITHDK